MAKVRVTNHNGRVSKKTGKPYDPKHNDRNFDKENAENLLDNPERKNIDHQWLDDLDPDNKSQLFSMLHIDKETLTNEEAESLYYQIFYKKWLDDQNEKHLKSRHTERIKNMDMVRENKNYCPEEEILKIGKMEDEQVDPKVYDKCVDEYISFLKETYGTHLHILDWNTHSDEAGGMHTHIRWVWDYTDEKDGLLKIGQDKALEQLGFDLPDPTQKRSRYNNRKQPFTAQNREKWLDICEAHGIEVERTADKKALRGQELYEMNQANQNIEKENERLTEAIKSLNTQKKGIEDALPTLQDSLKAQIAPITSSIVDEVNNMDLTAECPSVPSTDELRVLKDGLTIKEPIPIVNPNYRVTFEKSFADEKKAQAFITAIGKTLEFIEKFSPKKIRLTFTNSLKNIKFIGKQKVNRAAALREFLIYKGYPNAEIEPNKNVKGEYMARVEYNMAYAIDKDLNIYDLDRSTYGKK
ncbi:MAG: hypothetical protein IJJ64_07925, partial [Butyrivibrio sp.]|nr:hypothetical protein [Butyrivibrio sp.]